MQTIIFSNQVNLDHEAINEVVNDFNTIINQWAQENQVALNPIKTLVTGDPEVIIYNMVYDLDNFNCTQDNRNALLDKLNKAWGPDADFSICNAFPYFTVTAFGWS